MVRLRELLAPLGPGSMSETTELERSLACCWDEFDGSAEGGMEGDKLLGRMESVGWQPPVLTFVIERHGGIVRGSTRAELQHWSVNLDDATATLSRTGHRQLEPMSPRITTSEMRERAGRLAELIVNGRDDERLRR